MEMGIVVKIHVPIQFHDIYQRRVIVLRSSLQSRKRRTRKNLFCIEVNPDSFRMVLARFCETNGPIISYFRFNFFASKRKEKKLLIASFRFQVNSVVYLNTDHLILCFFVIFFPFVSVFSFHFAIFGLPATTLL